jgi:hypothetical protein
MSQTENGSIKKKCQKCLKKKLVVEQCKCQKIFCLDCLPSFNHNCDFNWRQENKNNLEKMNPKIIAVKVSSI